MDIHDIILVATTLFGFVGTLFGGAGIYGYLKVRSENQKILAEVGNINAQADKTSAEAWVMLVQSQQSRITQLEAQVGRIPILEAQVAELTTQIIQLGGKPKTGPLKEKKEQT